MPNTWPRSAGWLAKSIRSGYGKLRTHWRTGRARKTSSTSSGSSRIGSRISGVAPERRSSPAPAATNIVWKATVEKRRLHLFPVERPEEPRCGCEPGSDDHGERAPGLCHRSSAEADPRRPEPDGETGNLENDLSC